MGWLATIPTRAAVDAAEPDTMLGANKAWTSRNSPSSRTCSMTSCMSYGWLGESGMRCRAAVLVGDVEVDSVVERRGRNSMLLLGR
jgi:hypothetical protein